jgi:hypothetical protein
MTTRNARRKALAYGAATVAMIGATFVIVVPDARVTVARMLLPGVCMTEELKTIPNVSGMKFEAIYTNCDTLLKEDDVSVYVSTAVGGGKSWFARWRNRRTLIFSYVPGRSDTLSIEASGDDRILISIPDVSAVLLQRREWRKMHIDYNIRRVYYP